MATKEEREQQERERKEAEFKRDNERRQRTADRLSEYLGTHDDPRPPWARD